MPWGHVYHASHAAFKSARVSAICLERSSDGTKRDIRAPSRAVRRHTGRALAKPGAVPADPVPDSLRSIRAAGGRLPPKSGLDVRVPGEDE
jgi:hypothetical protein